MDCGGIAAPALFSKSSQSILTGCPEYATIRQAANQSGKSRKIASGALRAATGRDLQNGLRIVIRMIEGKGRTILLRVAQQEARVCGLRQTNVNAR